MKNAYQLFSLLILGLCTHTNLFAQNEVDEKNKVDVKGVTFGVIKPDVKEAIKTQQNKDASNPFQDLGKETNAFTLSEGRYNEFHGSQHLRKIGNKLIDLRTGEIVALAIADTLYSEATLEPEIQYRFPSPDILASAFPFSSPYTYAANNPIWFVDFEGMMPVTRTFTFEGQTFTFKTDTETPQDFTISSGFLGLNRTRFNFRSTNNNRKSLALLRGGHSQELRANADVRKMSSVHRGVLVTELLLSALEQNPDIKLVIVGNHAIPTVQTLEQQNRLAQLYEGAADLKSTRGNVTVKGEDRTFENEAEFARDRANFAKEQFFNNSSLVNTGAAEADFNSSSFPNVDIPDLGNDAVGITIVFDFSKTTTNPKPRKGGGGKKAPTREVYHSVRFLCFAEGTKVLMGDKESLNIENIKIGDVILNYNEALNQIEIDTVTRIDKVIHNNIVEIKFDNTEINVNTDDHPYLVKGKGWSSYKPKETESKYGIPCQKLEVGDECHYYDGTSDEIKFVKIAEIAEMSDNITTYNLTGLAKNSSYIANGVIVGNESKPKKIQEKDFAVNSFEEISNRKIKKNEKVKAKEVAQYWLSKKSDSLHISAIQLSELTFNPDEATMQLFDKYEEEKNTMSINKKNELITAIEESGFYFIDGTYVHKTTGKKHLVKFAYNLDKEISYVFIKEAENKEKVYFENLTSWNK